MRKVLLIASILLSSLSFAQKVDLKKGIVYFDKNPTYSYDREMFGNLTNIYRLNTKDMLITLSYENNGTSEYKDDDFVKIFFYETNTLIETKKLRGLFFKQMLERMRKMGVMDNAGVLDPAKVEGFRIQYHEEYLRIN